MLLYENFWEYEYLYFWEDHYGDGMTFFMKDKYEKSDVYYTVVDKDCKLMDINTQIMHHNYATSNFIYSDEFHFFIGSKNLFKNPKTSLRKINLLF